MLSRSEALRRSGNDRRAASAVKFALLLVLFLILVSRDHPSRA
jgi:Flp pilus assembly protein TadG